MSWKIRRLPSNYKLNEDEITSTDIYFVAFGIKFFEYIMKNPRIIGYKCEAPGHQVTYVLGNKDDWEKSLGPIWRKWGHDIKDYDIELERVKDILRENGCL